MENTQKKAVIYCRVSTKEQAEEGGSLATQEKLCKDYALKNGFEVTEVFIEQGESAKNANRTELKRLLDYCTSKKNGIKAVIAYKIDRVARNIDDYRQIRLLLKRYSVDVKSVTEFFEDNPAGRFMENIIANVAQFDNDVRTERSVNGSRDAMREGRYVWSAPYGYSNSKVAGKCTIVQNDKANIIRKVFVEVAKNEYPVDAIRQRLFKEGLKTATGKIFTKSHYYKLLNNELYAGWIIKFGERHKGSFEPIISEELYDQVRRVIKHRTHRCVVYKRENPDFPLRRFVMHPSGKKITGSWSQGRAKKYAYYRFKEISLTDVAKDKLEGKFKQFLNSFSLNQKHLDYFKKAIKEAYDTSTERDFREAKKHKEYIAELDARQTALIDKNAKGIISDSILRRQLEQNEEKLMQAHSDLLLLPDKKEDLGELLDFASEYLKDPSVVWDNATFRQKIELQWFEFPQGVTFHKGKFRTKEIASIFKVKDLFTPPLSSTVPSRVRKYQHTTTAKLPHIPIETCRQYAKELQRLLEILKEDPP